MLRLAVCCVLLVASSSGLELCDQNIVGYFEANSHFGEDALQWLSSRAWRYHTVNQEQFTVNPLLLCVKQFFSPQCDGCRDAHALTYQTDGTVGLQQCEVHDQGNGHILELKPCETNHIYLWETGCDDVVVWYRCTSDQQAVDGTGHDFTILVACSADEDSCCVKEGVEEAKRLVCDVSDVCLKEVSKCPHINPDMEG